MRTILLAILLLPSSVAASSVLDDVRREVREEEKEEEEKTAREEPEESNRDAQREEKRRSHHHHEDHDDNSNSSVDFINGILFIGYAVYGVGYIVTAPFWGPPDVLEPGESRDFRYEDYPYAGHFRGNLRLDPPYERRSTLIASLSDTEPVWVEEDWTEGSQEWSLQLGVDGAFLPNGRVGRGSASMRLWTPSRLELQTRVDGLTALKGDSSLEDSLMLGSGGVAIRFAHDEFVQFRIGANLRWLYDDKETNFGATGFYAIEAFPAEPVVLGATIEAGVLGNAVLIDGRVTFGIMLRNIEIHLGYQHTQIGSAPLSGPLFGVRAWF